MTCADRTGSLTNLARFTVGEGEIGLRHAGAAARPWITHQTDSHASESSTHRLQSICIAIDSNETGGGCRRTILLTRVCTSAGAAALFRTSRAAGCPAHKLRQSLSAREALRHSSESPSGCAEAWLQRAVTAAESCEDASSAAPPFTNSLLLGKMMIRQSTSFLSNRRRCASAHGCKPKAGRKTAVEKVTEKSSQKGTARLLPGSRLSLHATSRAAAASSSAPSLHAARNDSIASMQLIVLSNLRVTPAFQAP